MGQSITLRQMPDLAPIRMSNGLSAVVLDVLSLAACELARTDWERSVAFWLVRHDSELIGSGTGLFDVGDFGWSTDDFAAQKAFVLEVIEAAREKRGWMRLAYEPREDWVGSVLSRFSTFVVAFSREMIREVSAAESFVPGDLPMSGSCEVHGIFLHEGGCIVCNNSPIDTPARRVPHRGR